MSIEASRIAEIYAPLPNDLFSYGSGYLVSPNLILTARHVVDSALPGSPLRAPPVGGSLTKLLTKLKQSNPDRCYVRILADWKEEFVEAMVVWYDAAVDVALVAPLPPAWQAGSLAALSWADIPTGEPVDVLATGFPAKNEDVASHSRDTHELIGQIAPLSQYKKEKWEIGARGIVGRAHIALESSWAGMSGAAVFTGDILLGVIEADPHPQNTELTDLWATPAAKFAGRIDFVAWIAADAGPDAWRSASLIVGNQTQALPTLPPINVPALPEGGLEGRAEVVATVLNQLASGHDVAVSSGLPGIGKTAVAIAAFRQSAESFPDGRLWLPVGRGDPAGMSHWVDRIAVWARDLGVSSDAIHQAQLNKDGAALAAYVGAAIGERRTLLVFDDVWNEDDAIVFKGIGANCRRILTTRRPGVGAYFAMPVCELQELDRASSRRLIERSCPDAFDRFGDLLEQVLDALSDLPLTVMLVGKRLQIEQVLGDKAAARFLTRVLDQRSRMDLELNLPEGEATLLKGKRTLRAVIDLTTSGLQQHERAALRHLTAFPPKANSFSDDAAAYVAGHAKYVEALSSNGLLDMADSTPRWTMHQAIFDFAQEDGTKQKAAFRRMTEFFVTRIAEVSAGNDPSWMRQIQFEIDNIRTALEWTVAAGESTLALRLMSALWTFWYETNRFQRALQFAELVLAIPAPEEPDRQYRLLRAKVTNDAGNYSWNMGHLDSAERYYEESLQIRTELGEQGLTAGSLNNLGLVARERGNYEQARQLTDRALAINEETKHDQWLLWKGMNLNNLGIILDRQGNHSDAMWSQDESIAVFAELKKPWGIAMAQTDRAAAMINLGHLDDARILLTDVLSDRWLVRDDKRVAAALRGLARASAGADPARPAELLLDAIQLSLPIDDRLGEIAALIGLVLAADSCGDIALGARASGALRAHLLSTGITLSPWRQTALANGQRRLRHADPARFDADSIAACEAIGERRLSTWDTLGRAADAAAMTQRIQQLTQPASK